MRKRIALTTMVLSLLMASPVFAATVKSGTTMSNNAVRKQTSLQKVSDANHKLYTFINPEGKDLMARLVRAESVGEPFAGKVEVAKVVLNRMDSKILPNTIWGVIYQKNQFSPVKNGQIKKLADPDSIRAVDVALRTDRSKGPKSLYFYNPKSGTSTYFSSRKTTIIIGHHIFKQ